MNLALPTLLHSLRKPAQPETSVGLQDIALPHVQVVRRPRQPPSFIPALQLQLRHLQPFKQKVVATQQSLAALDSVVAPVPSCRVRNQLSEDIAERLLEYLALSGYEQAEVSLSLVHNTSCPRFHADYVKVRGLCTFVGPGTIWTDNANVPLLSRLLKTDGGLQLLDSSAVHQADPCEVLYLKGREWPGNPGMGAVHRSPEGASAQSPRLLLTLDKAPECECCQE